MYPILLDKLFKSDKLISKNKFFENLFLSNDFLKKKIQVSKNKIYIKPTFAGDYLLYIHIKDNKIYISESLKNLNIKFEIKEKCISALLEWGLIPFPLTPYKNTYRIGIGQSAEIKFKDNLIFLKIIQNHYFDFEEKKNYNNYSNNKFEELLCSSIDKKIKNSDSTVFMTSAGKDSISLAIACAELGYNNCRFVTYNDSSTINETDASKEILKKLNLNQYSIKYSEYKKFKNLDFLDKFFKLAEFPVIDNATLPYLISISSMNTKSNVEQIIDGMGNDIYLGHILNNKAKIKFLLSNFNFVNNRFIENFSRVSKLRYLIRPHQLTYLPSNYLLGSEIIKILNLEYDKDFIKENFKVPKNLLYNSKYYKALTRGVHYDFGVAMEKARFASAGLNCECFFPWTDEDLSRYLFNQKSLILFKKNINKVFLRKYLEYKINYSQYKIPKVGFGFNSASFILENKREIRSSILDCAYIKKLYGEEFINENFDKIKKNSKFATGLIGLYIVSNWLNKSILL